VHGARRVVVVMEHVTRDGDAKLLRSCTLPLTGRAVVHRVVTDLAVLDVAGDHFSVVELAPGTSWLELVAATDAPLRDARATAPEPGVRVPA
jgi:3-oxoacid CoA-transferase subunit B